MSYFKNTKLDLNNATGDAFGRLRVSNPITLFDSKQLFDNAPLFWDESLETGAGITSAHDSDLAASTFTSTLNTAGKYTRQTFMRFNYQPGKSHMILLTGVLSNSGGGTGVQRSIGYFDDDNGIYFQDDEDTIKVCLRTNTTGTPTDTKIAQSSWNVDPMDGTGPSGVTLDTSKTLIYAIDFEWLGVGRVRTGIVIAGVTHVVHEFLHSNLETDVYMSTPNLPIRYQMETTGASPASTMKCICSSVISEGGVQDNGVLRYTSTEGTHIDCNVANTVYAISGIRLKSTHLGSVVKIVSLTMVNATSDDYEWLLILNPTVAVPNTWTNQTNSSIQTTVGSTTATDNVVTGGVKMIGGMVKAGGGTGSITIEISNALLLGAAIDGTVDEMYLCCRPFTANADIDAGITWRELS